MGNFALSGTTNSDSFLIREIAYFSMNYGNSQCYQVFFRYAIAIQCKNYLLSGMSLTAWFSWWAGISLLSRESTWAIITIFSWSSGFSHLTWSPWFTILAISSISPWVSFWSLCSRISYSTVEICIIYSEITDDLIVKSKDFDIQIDYFGQ